MADKPFLELMPQEAIPFIQHAERLVSLALDHRSEWRRSLAVGSEMLHFA